MSTEYKKTTRLSGVEAERRAEEFLCSRGLQVVERNFSCKAGEIDLIMRDGRELVFVEVRFRKNNLFGSAAESVTINKQKKLIRSANYFLLNRNTGRLPCRFDVVGITGSDIQWIPAAFQGIQA